MKDYLDAKYFIYLKRGGWYFGWHFLQSGGLTEINGIRAFDCGEYGTAYVALNKDNLVTCKRLILYHSCYSLVYFRNEYKKKM